jgi:HSP20 family molecular chaperone IbpA
LTHFADWTAISTRCLASRSPRTENENFFAPAIDVRETDKEYQIKAELPGLEKDQVNWPSMRGF